MQTRVMVIASLTEKGLFTVDGIIVQIYGTAVVDADYARGFDCSDVCTNEGELKAEFIVFNRKLFIGYIKVAVSVSVLYVL